MSRKVKNFRMVALIDVLKKMDAEKAAGKAHLRARRRRS
jgi:hypothetical protein